MVEDLQVADLVPDDVVEHALGREQQAPVEAHRARRPSTTPSACAGRGSTGRCRRLPAMRGGAVQARARSPRARRAGRSARAPAGGRPPARAAARRDGARACARAAGPAAARRRGRAPCPARAATCASARRPSDSRRSIHGRSSRTAAAAARSGARAGSTTSTPVWARR